jgi:hypothetical protein
VRGGVFVGEDTYEPSFTANTVHEEDPDHRPLILGPDGRPVPRLRETVKFGFHPR